MAIAIKVSPELFEPGSEEEKRPVQAKRILNIRKALDGSLILFDHPDIDIVVSPKKNNLSNDLFIVSIIFLLKEL